MRVLGILVAAVLIGGACDAARAACKINMLAELPVHMVAGQPRVTVIVNGHEAEAVVSTGAQQSMVRAWAAKRLEVFAFNVDAEMVMRGTTVPARGAELGTIQLGKLTLKRAPIFVAGDDRRDRGEEDMVLGSNFFSEADLEFDLPHNTLRILKPEGCKDDEVLYWGGAYSVVPSKSAAEGQHEPRLDVLINGRKVEALLASASFNSFISASTAQSVGSRPAPGAKVEWDVLRRRPRTFDSVVIDQEALKNVTIDVVEIKQVFDQSATGRRLAAQIRTDSMVLGADFLAAHRLLIANDQHRIYFTYEKGPAFQPSTPDDAGPTKE